MVQCKSVIVQNTKEQIILSPQEFRLIQKGSSGILGGERIISRLSIDETALSNGELYTIITNKEAKGRKGAIVAMIKGTVAEDIIGVLKKIPERSRKRQVYKIFKADLKAIGWVQHDILNLKKLPIQFHANHPAYNNYIMREMNLLK